MILIHIRASIKSFTSSNFCLPAHSVFTEALATGGKLKGFYKQKWSLSKLAEVLF